VFRGHSCRENGNGNEFVKINLTIMPEKFDIY
jgi:hypothetical protein